MLLILPGTSPTEYGKRASHSKAFRARQRGRSRLDQDHHVGGQSLLRDLRRIRLPEVHVETEDGKRFRGCRASVGYEKRCHPAQMEGEQRRDDRRDEQQCSSPPRQQQGNAKAEESQRRNQ